MWNLHTNFDQEVLCGPRLLVQRILSVKFLTRFVEVITLCTILTIALSTKAHWTASSSTLIQLTYHLHMNIRSQLALFREIAVNSKPGVLVPVNLSLEALVKGM